MGASVIKIRRGLDLPLTGAADVNVEQGVSVSRVALLGDDTVGMKPTMAVAVGDAVKLGQLLYTDKKTEGVRYTSPGSGIVEAINRGDKRKFESIVIRLSGSDEETFRSFKSQDPARIGRTDIRDVLVESGLWTSFKTRPFSKVPAIDAVPHSIFVQAIDTQPLAADPVVALRGLEADFERGLDAIAQLTEGSVYLCTRPGAELPKGRDERIKVQQFAGPHPAGLPGTHIHMLDPVNAEKTVWSVGYQDVAAIGHLLQTGQILVDRVVALAGPQVRRPRLLRTRLGASVDELVAGELNEGETRVISGSVLSGRTAAGPLAFLGRFHLQVSAIAVDKKRPILGWLGPGLNKFSIKPTFLSALLPGRRVPMGTAAYGDPRAIITVGAFEKVMPLDIIPSELLKALAVGDAERAQMLGCLELDEDDLSLCSFVDPGKGNFGTSLRHVLTTIEKEG